MKIERVLVSKVLAAVLLAFVSVNLAGCGGDGRPSGAMWNDLEETHASLGEQHAPGSQEMHEQAVQEIERIINEHNPDQGVQQMLRDMQEKHERLASGEVTDPDEEMDIAEDLDMNWWDLLEGNLPPRYR